MSAAPSKSKLIRFAQRQLGLGGVSMRETAEAAANALEVPHAPNKHQGYLVLAHFYDVFKHALKPPNAPNRPHSKGPRKPRKLNVNDDAFLMSFEWRQLRMKVLVKYSAVCQCCGASRKDGVVIHVDHIKPRRKHPELALTEANLQVLCEVCNHGKGAWDETDWRDDSQTLPQSSRTPQRQPGDGDEQNTLVVRGPRLIKTKAAG